MATTHVGSSPRWRGAHPQTATMADQERIIPALAGSTAIHAGQPAKATDHPRAGGEHVLADHLDINDQGSSPRWRGAPRRVGYRCLRMRIIPALAGSTAARNAVVAAVTDHPRAGGEHTSRNTLLAGSGGSSPRWRGALVIHLGFELDLGIIPALAGSTTGFTPTSVTPRDHPRAGGEHGG